MVKYLHCLETKWICTNWVFKKRACDQCKQDRWEGCVDGTWVSDRPPWTIWVQRGRLEEETIPKDDEEKNKASEDVTETMKEDANVSSLGPVNRKWTVLMSPDIMIEAKKKKFKKWLKEHSKSK